MCGPTTSFSPAGPGMETVSVSQPTPETDRKESNGEDPFEKKLQKVYLSFSLF